MSTKVEATYRTRSLYEGAYLLAEGFPLLESYHEAGKAVLVFEDSPALQAKVAQFYEPGSQPRRLFQEYLSLKDRVLGR